MKSDLRTARAHWVIAVAAPLTAVAFSTATLDPTSLPKWWLTVLVTLLALSLVAVSVFRTRTLDLPNRPFLVAVFLLVLACAVSVLVAEEQMRAVMGTYGRWGGAAAYVSYGGLALLTATTVTDDRRRHHVGTGVITGAVVVGAYAVVQRVGIDPVPWTSQYGGAHSFLGNPNFASAYLGIVVPLVVARVLARWSSRVVASGYLLALVLLVAGIWSTGSWLGVAAAGSGLVAMALVMFGTSSVPHALRLATLAAIGSVAVAGTILHGFWTGWLSAPNAAAARLYYWRTAIGMFVENPLTGIGLGRFEDFFRRYRPPEQFEEFPPSVFTDNPHSVPLTLASEGGLVMLIPWLLVVGTVLMLVTRWLLRYGADGEHGGRARLAVSGWTGAFVAYVVQSLVSFEVPPVAVLGWVCAGVVVASVAAPISRSLARNSSGILAAGAVVASVALVTLAWTPVRADSQASAGLGLLASGDLASAVASFDSAATLAWWEPRYRLLAASAVAGGGDLEGAFVRLEEAARAFPMRYVPAVESARLAVELGYDERAAYWYREALMLEPHDPELLAEATEVLGADTPDS